MEMIKWWLFCFQIIKCQFYQMIAMLEIYWSKKKLNDSKELSLWYWTFLEMKWETICYNETNSDWKGFW